jgi:hypothetical protein
MRNTTWPDGFPANAFEFVLLLTRLSSEEGGEWFTCRPDGTKATGVRWKHKFRAVLLPERIEKACDNLYNLEFRILRYSRSCTRRRRYGC